MRCCIYLAPGELAFGFPTSPGNTYCWLLVTICQERRMKEQVSISFLSHILAHHQVWLVVLAYRDRLSL